MLDLLGIGYLGRCIEEILILAKNILQQKTVYPLWKIVDPLENDPVLDSFDG